MNERGSVRTRYHSNKSAACVSRPEVLSECNHERMLHSLIRSIARVRTLHASAITYHQDTNPTNQRTNEPTKSTNQYHRSLCRKIA